MRRVLAAIGMVSLAMAAGPAGAAAPVMAPGTEADRTPDWLVKPDGPMMAKYYPERAWREDVEGRATLLCTVATDTRLTSCQVQAESPPGYGFGSAALNVADEMRMAPAIRNGLPVEALVRVPLVFKMPESEPPAPPMSPSLLFGLAGGSLAFALLMLGGLIGAYRLFGRSRSSRPCRSRRPRTCSPCP